MSWIGLIRDEVSLLSFVNEVMSITLRVSRYQAPIGVVAVTAGWFRSHLHQDGAPFVNLAQYYWLFIPEVLNSLNPSVPPASTHQTPHSAHTMYLCVPYGSHNKQRLFPQTALTGWAL
jgi:hypothetical protein